MYTLATVGLMTLNEDARPLDRLPGPKEIANFCADLSNMAQEQFVVLTFDTKTRVTGRHMVSLGTLCSTLVHPREVFRPAVIDCAASIVVVHNHPSGDPSPSSNDIRITKKLIEASAVLEIPLLDHVIIGRKLENQCTDGWFLSLRETGLVSFDSHN